MSWVSRILSPRFSVSPLHPSALLSSRRGQHFFPGVEGVGGLSEGGPAASRRARGPGVVCANPEGHIGLPPSALLSSESSMDARGLRIARALASASDLYRLSVPLSGSRERWGGLLHLSALLSRVSSRASVFLPTRAWWLVVARVNARAQDAAFHLPILHPPWEVFCTCRHFFPGCLRVRASLSRQEHGGWGLCACIPWNARAQAAAFHLPILHPLWEVFCTCRHFFPGGLRA